jgi:uncharacterized protein
MGPSEKQRITLQTLGAFLALNAALTLLLGFLYVLEAPGVEGWLGYGYLLLALLSSVLIAYLGLSLLLVPILAALPGRLPLLLITFPALLGLHLLTFVDFTIYRLYRFHINSMVLNLFQTDGAWDSVDLGARTLGTAGAAFLGLAVAEVLLLRALYRRFDGRRQEARTPAPKRTTVAVIAVSLAAGLIVADKFAFAAADFYGVSQITRHRAVLPLYVGVTMNRFLEKHGLLGADREPPLGTTSNASPLRYPKAALARSPLPAYPNVVWIVVDAWRFDMLNEAVAPRMWAFSKRALVFRNHYSGGNASRFGVYSLFYGVYGYYWQQFLDARQSPIWIDELLKLGYDLRIMSSTMLTYPEFRKTAFVSIPDDIDDHLPGRDAGEKDPILAQHFLDWLAGRHGSKPFFGFLFFNAPHGPYAYPPEFELFTPSRKTANYVTVGKHDVIPLKNSYQNAIRFDDAMVGKILAYLDTHGLLESTIVLITSDHGEEFYENGYLGHTSAFTKYQTKVPLILYLPGQSHQEVDRLTSHLDVVPTLLGLLGYTSPPSVYSQGLSLLEDPHRDAVVSCGWDSCGVIGPAHTVVFSTETYNAYLFDVRDEQYRRIADFRPILERESASLLHVLEGFRTFNK